MAKGRSAKQQLKNFHWKGVNSSGKKVSGKVLARTEHEVRNMLRLQHIRVKKLRMGNASLTDKMGNKVNGKDITILTRQLSTMLSTGLPLLQSLKLVGDNHKKAEMKSILTQIIKDTEAGTPLSKTMRTASPFFDGLYTDLVTTGEQAGNLPEIFERLATYREKSEELRSKVVKAMIYPAMVVLVALGVSYMMLTMVIPEFEVMFKGFNAELPWFTQQVLHLSHWLQAYSFLLAAAIAGTIFTIRAVRKSSFPFRLKTSKMALGIPLIGSVLSKAAIAKFSRTLATSFNAGIPILNALKTSAKTAGNLYYEVAVTEVYTDTAAGVPIYVAMRNTEAFPEMVLQMVMIGEESGCLDEMLNKVAAVYEFEVDNTVDNLGKILEPLIIIFLGVVVGGLVVSMYLPIFSMMSVVG